MSSHEVLNRQLYRRLLKTFGHVRIKNKGEAQKRKVSTNVITGKKETKILDFGETYAVCCPACNDTRFRCYISHRYGTFDEFNRVQTRLAVCFNAGCPLMRKDREAFRLIETLVLDKNLHSLTASKILEGKEVDTDKIRTNWPGEVTRIDTLPLDHPAVGYLTERQFDVKVLGRYYNVQWCSESDRWLCANRIVIPIYHKKKMVGWQCRPPFDLNWKESTFPKYYTAPGTPRRQILYNFGNSIRYQVGVVTEGVTDVWRLGPQGVCTLGANFTQQQQKLFVSGFKDHAGILLYDGDIKIDEKLQAMVADLHRQLKSGFYAVSLPDAADPGSLSREYLRNYINQYVAEHYNAAISWEKR